MTPVDARAGGSSPSLLALIVAQGLVTLAASILFMPVGGALVLVNAVGAMATRGVNRAFFATVAITGAVGLLCVLVFGFHMYVTQEVSVVRQ